MKSTMNPKDLKSLFALLEIDYKKNQSIRSVYKKACRCLEKVEEPYIWDILFVFEHYNKLLSKDRDCSVLQHQAIDSLIDRFFQTWVAPFIFNFVPKRIAALLVDCLITTINKGFVGAAYSCREVIVYFNPDLLSEHADFCPTQMDICCFESALHYDQPEWALRIYQRLDPHEQEALINHRGIYSLLSDLYHIRESTSPSDSDRYEQVYELIRCSLSQLTPEQFGLIGDDWSQGLKLFQDFNSLPVLFLLWKYCDAFRDHIILGDSQDDWVAASTAFLNVVEALLATEPSFYTEHLGVINDFLSSLPLCRLKFLSNSNGISESMQNYLYSVIVKRHYSFGMQLFGEDATAYFFRLDPRQHPFSGHEILGDDYGSMPPLSLDTATGFY